MYSMPDVCGLLKKLLEIHDYDGATFETDSVLALIEGILNLVTSGMENELPDPSEIRSISDTLHKISCVFNCKCSEGDAAMEILKLVSSYQWEAKIAIVLATFVVEYAQFSHAIKLYNDNRLGELVSILKQIPDNIDDCFYQMKSKFKTLIDQAIKVTRLIAQFSSLGSKYISNDVEPMADAVNQIPIAVYSMTKVVVDCASQLREILGKSEIDLSTEIWCDQSLELITRTRTYFKEKLDRCRKHIAEKKLTGYVAKLKKKFKQTTVYADNQKILQLIINTKDGNSHPLESGLDKVGLEALKGKTVLLFISDLDIPYHEILMLNNFYQDSRLSLTQQYEIVWLPTVENIETNENLKQKFEEWKSVMKWYCLQHPSSLKPGVVKYMEEELHYSKKNSILVALDPWGKIVNPNAFNMVWKWGNAAYPFTTRCELDLRNRMKWSLQLLVGGIDHTLTNWIKEGKIICLFGGKDKAWIEEFVTRARKVENDADIKIEMMFIGKDPSEEVIEILEKWNSLILNPESIGYFLERIESMKASVTDGANKESIVVEMDNMHRLAHSKSWALISQGAGLGADEIARGVGDEMLRGLQEFESWRVEARKGFVVALNGHVAGRPLIPPPDFCTVCRRFMYGCYTQ